VTDEVSLDRAAGVRRRFKRARLNAMGRGFWEHWNRESSAFLGGMYVTAILLFLEPACWSDTWPAGLIDVRIPDALALSLLLILPFNGWLIDRFLSSKTRGETHLPGWLLGLRRLSACFPLGGLYTISTWRVVLERRVSTRGYRSASLDLSRGRESLPRGDRWRVLYQSGFFFVWMAVGVLPLLVWALWLTRTMVLGSHRRPVILAVCALLHLIAGLSMAMYLRSEIEGLAVRGWRKALLSAAPVLWLFAIPGMVLGFTAFLLADPSHKSLTWLAYAGRTSAVRTLAWRRLQGGLRQHWQEKPWFVQWTRPTGLAPSRNLEEADAQITSFYRLKSLLLVLDSAFVFGAAPAGARNAALPWVLWTAAALASVGMIVQLAGLSARLLRVSLAQSFSRHPYGRYLLLTQAAFLAGLYMAALWAAGQVQPFGVLLCLGGALCGVLAVLFLFFTLAASPHGPDMTLWAVLFLSLSAWGALIALDGAADQTSLATLRVLSALAPLWSLGLYLALSGWLLRPFSWRHVFDPTADWKLRTALGFMILTVALPLGGLAIPFLIFARHRVLRRYEPRSRP
jgi:hypothetical protein